METKELKSLPLTEEYSESDSILLITDTGAKRIPASTFKQGSGGNVDLENRVSTLEKKVLDLEAIVNALQDSMGSVVTYGKLILSETAVTVGDTLSAKFTVKLDKAPTEVQTVTLASDNDILLVSPVSISFTADNYGTEQEITVSIVEPSAEVITANVTVSTENDTAVVSVNITESESAVEWYTLTTDDMTYTAQSSWKRTMLNSINTTDKPNVIIPATIEGYPTMPGGLNVLPKSIVKLKFEDGEYYKNDCNFKYTSASPNTTLENVYGIPPNINALNVQYCDALKTMDLSKVKSATSISFASNAALTEAPQLAKDITGLTSLQKAFWRNPSLKTKRYVIPDVVVRADHMLYACGITEFTFDSSWEHLQILNNALDDNPIERVIYESDVFDKIIMFNGVEPNNGVYISNIKTLADSVTFVVNFNSAIYKKIRYMQASEDYACRNLRLEMKDGKPIKNVSFWGDSLTRRNEPTTSHGYMVEQFSNCMADDVMSWNYGRGGENSSTFAKYFDAQPQRYGDLSVIWLGTNDTGISGAQTVENIKNNYISKLTGDYIVVMPWGWGYPSDNKEAFENAGFGNKLLNVHEYVIQNGFDILGKTPTAEEQAQLDEGTIPDIYVDTSDHTHLTKYGGQVISAAIKAKMLELGYITDEWLSEEGKNTSVSISADTLSVGVGATGTLTATSGNGADITWSCTDEAVATVTDGIVTGVASGTCYVIARCGSYSKFCTVTVS